jgi:hypothetical protein
MAAMGFLIGFNPRENVLAACSRLALSLRPIVMRLPCPDPCYDTNEEYARTLLCRKIGAMKKASEV